MMTVPPTLLELLDIEAGAAVNLVVDDGRLIVAPQKRPHYTMDELLAASDYSQPQPAAEREWVDVPAVGREPL